MDDKGIVDTFHINDIDASFVVYVPDVELKRANPVLFYQSNLIAPMLFMLQQMRIC